MDDPTSRRFWAKIDFDGPIPPHRPELGPCWLWTGWKTAIRGPDGGYGMFKWNGHDRGAHIVMWEITRGPVPEGFNVCHHCDNRSCPNPAHLFLGSQAENQADMVAKSRSARGQKQHLAKLTEDQVVGIRNRYAAGATQLGLAADYGVHQKTIWNIICRRTWRHVL